MSQKAMVFIDGGWLYKSRQALFARLGEDNFEINYEKLPKVLCECVANALDEDISLVRTCYFGTIPSSRSGVSAGKQSAFYDFLEKNCGYETTIHAVDVSQPDNRDTNWVRMSIAADLLFYAAQHGAYDVAIVVGDDADLTPVIRRTRLLGKRVQVVGTHPTDGKGNSSLISKSRVNDFPPVYLDDHAQELRLVRELRRRVCRQCGIEEETTWAGPDFFCKNCRGKFRNQP